MRLPQLTSERQRNNAPTAGFPGGVAPQGCDIGCLLMKAPQCIPICASGNIAGCIACAGSAAAACGCL